MVLGSKGIDIVSNMETQRPETMYPTSDQHADLFKYFDGASRSLRKKSAEWSCSNLMVEIVITWFASELGNGFSIWDDSNPHEPTRSETFSERFLRVCFNHVGIASTSRKKNTLWILEVRFEV